MELIDIEKILKQSDFSKSSATHKERLKQELNKKTRPLSESEMFLAAAAGEYTGRKEPVTPGSACIYGIKSNGCGCDNQEKKCEYLSLENGTCYCVYKN